MEHDKPGWHLDRRVPITLIIVIVTQLVGFGILYGNLENRVTHLEQESVEFKKVIKSVTRMEALFEKMARDVERIEQRLSNRSQP